MVPTVDTSDLTDTLILVDVDGVLNIGVRDLGDAPLLFNQPNMGFAESMRGRKAACRADQESVDKLLSVADHEVGGGEEGTYSKFMCGPSSHISGVLAKRLAGIIKKAGSNHSVVLSSNWRRPHHASRVRKLEAEVSQHLGSSWAFSTTTKQADEKRAGDRLRCIGDFVESFCHSGKHAGDRQLRFLLLEDFFITALDGWVCDGVKISSTQDAEDYVRSRAPREMDVAVKLIHTYDEWTASTGVRVQVGAGLGDKHVRDAEAFLDRDREQKVPVSPTRNYLADVVIKEIPRDIPSACEKAAELVTLGEEGGAIMDARYLYKNIAAWPWFSMYLRFAF